MSHWRRGHSIKHRAAFVELKLLGFTMAWCGTTTNVTHHSLTRPAYLTQILSNVVCSRVSELDYQQNTTCPVRTRPLVNLSNAIPQILAITPPLCPSSPFCLI